ncbi:hypothetical protein H6G45_11435 [Synechocystis sp. FACHB-383]|uniref:hypothetical protein n=1 Tax=Synechocystis sp. FACHB-383 TaxID=2692864 RepID=UPI001683CB4B|nr:hypothetical protein [Synechocystis sp. FACHB-383]MBD2654084.1 hypothetical protein [Synechocystis sp. FACHB-383]
MTQLAFKKYLSYSALIASVSVACVSTTLSQPALAQVSIAGDWSSSWGTVRLSQNGTSVSGYYAKPDQLLEGSISGNVLSGYWTKNMSARRCTTSRNGSFYWGRVRLVFNDSTFAGDWGHCGDEPTKKWTGSRSSQSTASTPSVPPVASVTSIGGNWTSSWGNISLNQNGANVTGYYAKPDQQLEGTMSGNILSGYWTKSSSGRRCTTSRNGSFYWGRVNLVFNGPTFSGLWGYCGDEPTRNWSGNQV